MNTTCLNFTNKWLFSTFQQISHAADLTLNNSPPKSISALKEDLAKSYTENGYRHLEWKNAPAGTKRFALISDDPDAPMGTWVHWVASNIPPDITKLEEDVKPEKEFKDGMRQGSNSWPRIGYGGPCPPSGTHRYYFKLYALDTVMDMKPGATKVQVAHAMKGHVLAEAQLMGKYKRQK